MFPTSYINAKDEHVFIDLRVFGIFPSKNHHLNGFYYRKSAIVHTSKVKVLGMNPSNPILDDPSLIYVTFEKYFLKLLPIL